MKAEIGFKVCESQLSDITVRYATLRSIQRKVKKNLVTFVDAEGGRAVSGQSVKKWCNSSMSQRCPYTTPDP